MKTKLLTKVAKGVAYGDVSNFSVRNILTEISKRIYGRFTEQEMFDTLEFFDWKCPYTGKDLRPLIENNQGGYAADHIYPQNKKWCGLNVKGNLVIVDKAANARKHDQDIETFLLTDTKVINDIDEIGRTRQERLDLIKKFQNECNYEPDKIRQQISSLLNARYDQLRSEQEQCIFDSLNALENINIYPISKNAIYQANTNTLNQVAKSVELVFYPSDESQFKQELLEKKKAYFKLTYDSGVIKESKWDVKNLDETSNLKNNIKSRPFWRNKKQEGLVKVEVFIDDCSCCGDI